MPIAIHDYIGAAEGSFGDVKVRWTATVRVAMSMQLTQHFKRALKLCRPPWLYTHKHALLLHSRCPCSQASTCLVIGDDMRLVQDFSKLAIDRLGCDLLHPKLSSSFTKHDQLEFNRSPLHVQTFLWGHTIQTLRGWWTCCVMPCIKNHVALTWKQRRRALCPIATGMHVCGAYSLTVFLGRKSM